MWRRYSPKTNRSFDAITRTNHFPRGGSVNGMEGRPRSAFDKMLTNRTISGRDAPNGFSISRRIRSRPAQFSTEFCSRSGFLNDKGACCTHIHDTIVAQFSGEDAWTKRPVSANIDSSEENNE